MTTAQLLIGGGLCGAVGTVLGVIIKEVFELIKRRGDRKAEKECEAAVMNKQIDLLQKEIDLLKEELEESKKERSQICFALFACLDGLIQKGANGTVTKARESLEKHINKKAHGLEE